ncbi:MAG: transglycosylase SLT domain-containing protein [Candidatus Thiothrix moscowensis]|nr:transglycosylase SLT domain-containing protein [Candidatus Thiothrix moscowensis]
MEKLMYFALSVALVFGLSATIPYSNPAEAAVKSVNYAKAGKSKRLLRAGRRAGRGGGCQTLSPDTLEQKASQYRDAITSASSSHGVSKDLVKAVITVESCFKSGARGSSGEKGLMQLMPGTARRFDIRNGYNAWQNVHGGTRYLSYLLDYYGGNTQRAVAAYNAGEGNVRKNGAIPNHGYVSKVMQAYHKFSQGRGSQPMKAVFTQPVARATQKPLPVAKPAVRTWRASAQALPWADMGKVAQRTGSYQVQAGDTVYEVMRQTGVPVKDIIRLNRLTAPYGIQSGQRLRLQ